MRIAERMDCADYPFALSLSIAARCNRVQIVPAKRAIGVAVPRKWFVFRVELQHRGFTAVFATVSVPEMHLFNQSPENSSVAG